MEKESTKDAGRKVKEFSQGSQWPTRVEAGKWPPPGSQVTGSLRHCSTGLLSLPVGWRNQAREGPRPVPFSAAKTRVSSLTASGLHQPSGSWGYMGCDQELPRIDSLTLTSPTGSPRCQGKCDRGDRMFSCKITCLTR